MYTLILPFLPYFPPFHLPPKQESIIYTITHPSPETSPITSPTISRKTSPPAIMGYFHRAASKSSSLPTYNVTVQSHNNNANNNIKPTQTYYIPPYPTWQASPPSAINPAPHQHAAKTTNTTSPPPSSPSLASFFLSSRYSDMIITCRGGRQFNTHRVIACAHSTVIEAAVSRICEVCSPLTSNQIPT